MPIAVANDRAALTPGSRSFGREVVGEKSHPLRICQVVPYALDENGGVKHHAVQLARALRATGNEMTIVGPSLQSMTQPDVRGFKGVFNINSNGSANRIGLLASFAEVWKFFRRSRFDVVHVHEPVVPMLGCWSVMSSLGSARVATFHSYREHPSWALGALAKMFASVQAPSFHVATAVSEAASAYAGTFWPQACAIVPNGVSLETFTPPTGARVPGPIRLLFVGRLGDKRKGFEHMLRAFESVRARTHNVVLDVVGELGGAVPPALPGLVYHGALPLADLAERYRRCDIFVAPSTGQESFGIVLLEAMASARPIICADIVGYRRTVAPAGTRLVAPGDPTALGNAILELAGQPELWPAMGETNLKRAGEFSWDGVARRMRDVYLSALFARRSDRGTFKGPIDVADRRSHVFQSAG